MADHSNDSLRHETDARRPFPALSPYSGDGVFLIPIGLIGLLTLLITLMTVFEPS